MAAHVESDDPEVRLLAAAADPVRLAMLRELAEAGEVCGCGFRILGTVTQPTISHHLRVLREAGLVTFTRERSYLLYRLDLAGIDRLAVLVDGLRPVVPTEPPLALDAVGGAMSR